VEKEDLVKIDIVIPVYNEAPILRKNVSRVVSFLELDSAYKDYKVIIVDNGSRDKTFEIAQELAVQYAKVNVIHLNQKGRGRALRKAWQESEADIVSYMDADLSTDLEAMHKLFNAIIIDGYDIAVGFRLSSVFRVKRTLVRSFLSYGYNLLIKIIWRIKELPDVQCGFKALTKNAADAIVPKIENQNWFFDTELLILAYRRRCKIKFIPVKWEERLNGKVKILDTVFEDIVGIVKLLIKK